MRKNREPSGNFFCVPNSIFKEKLKPKEFIVFCYLKYRSDYDFICFPSRKLMAKECRMSLPTLDSALKGLEDKCIVHVIRRCDSVTHNRISHLYKILWNG